MKLTIVLLLGLASLAISAPQSRFGTSRFQPAGVDYADDTTETANEANYSVEEGDTNDADLDATGPYEDTYQGDDEDTTSTPQVADKRPAAYGLDAAKERRRLANLRKRFRPNADEEDITDSLNDEGEEASVSGDRGTGAGEQNSNHKESTPEEDEEPKPSPVSNFRRRFHSTSSASSSVSDTSKDSEEETSSGGAENSDLAAVDAAYSRRRPSLRRRQQQSSTTSRYDDAQDEYPEEDSSVHSEESDSASPAEDEDQEPAAGTRTGASLKDRLERYRQRQAERLGTATQSEDPEDSGDNYQTSDDQPETTGDYDYKNSGEDRDINRFSADIRHENVGDGFTSSDNTNGQDN